MAVRSKGFEFTCDGCPAVVERLKSDLPDGWTGMMVEIQDPVGTEMKNLTLCKDCWPKFQAAVVAGLGIQLNSSQEIAAERAREKAEAEAAASRKG